MPTKPLPDRYEVLSAIFRETERFLSAWEPLHENYVHLMRAYRENIRNNGFASADHVAYINELKEQRARVLAVPRPRPVLIQEYLSDTERAMIARAMDESSSLARLAGEVKTAGDLAGRRAWVERVVEMTHPMGVSLGAVRRVYRDAAAKLEAPVPTPAVVLGPSHKTPPLVWGKKKPALSTPEQYKVIKMLVDAGDDGCTMEEVEGTVPSARRIVRNLREDADWATAFFSPGKKGTGGYRVAPARFL